MKFNGWTTKKGKSRDIEMSDGEIVTLEFYPVRVLRLLSMQEMIKGVWKAMTAIGNAKAGDFTYRITKTRHPDGRIEDVSDPILKDPIDTMYEREKGIDSAVSMLLHPDNVGMIGELLMSSLRDVDFGSTTPREFLADVDADVFRQLIHGFVAANEKVLPGFLRAEFKKALQRMESEDLQPQDSAEAAPSLRLNKDDDFSDSSSEKPESEQETPSPTTEPAAE